MRKFTILLLFLICSCSDAKFHKDWTSEKAPEIFLARFETTKGNFDIKIERKNSPTGVDRLYQLIKHGYFDHAIFYRVIPNSIAQFGNTDQNVMDQWRAVKIPDEPVKLSNTKGTISFARFGTETRDTELFINLEDNTQLDTIDMLCVKGFPALGRVSSGLDNVAKLYSGYGDRTMDDSERMYTNRADFLSTWPNLDQITKAYILEQ